MLYYVLIRQNVLQDLIYPVRIDAIIEFTITLPSISYATYILRDN
jgi:hypothetical protein